MCVMDSQFLSIESETYDHYHNHQCHHLASRNSLRTGYFVFDRSIFVLQHLAHSLAYSMCSMNTELMNNPMNKYAIEIFKINSYFIMKRRESLFKGTLWKIVMYNAKSPHCLSYISYIKFT